MPSRVHAVRLDDESQEHLAIVWAWLNDQTPAGIPITPSVVIRHCLAMGAEACSMVPHHGAAGGGDDERAKEGG
jgi:hypothetical protein